MDEYNNGYNDCSGNVPTGREGPSSDSSSASSSNSESNNENTNTNANSQEQKTIIYNCPTGAKCEFNQ